MVKCAVHLFLVKDGKILVEKRKNRDDYCNNQLDVIASHIIGNENVVDAIIRTAKVEVNINIKKEDLKIIQVMHQKCESYEYINYFFITDRYSGELKNNDINYCDGIEWVDFKYPIDNLEPYINDAIRNYIEEPDNHFAFYGWENN